MTSCSVLKRRTLVAAACVLGLGFPPTFANAQDWPSKQSIRLVVPWAPGGVADYLGRLLAPSLSRQLGQAVIVENRAGGATNIGTDAVAKAEPDGYTLLIASSNNAANMTLFKTNTYDFARDFAPIALLGYTPMVLVTNPSVPGKSLSDFLRYAKANPGKLSYASAGIGSPAHLAAEKFLRAADLQMVHVPYKGAAPAVNDLLGGQVQLLITNISSVVGQVKGGQLRALAVTGMARSPALPSTPTFAEAGLPSFDATAWYGIVARRGVPQSVVTQLATAIGHALADPAIEKRIEQQGVEAATDGKPASFAKLIADDIVGYRKLIQTAGITAN